MKKIYCKNCRFLKEHKEYGLYWAEYIYRCDYIGCFRIDIKKTDTSMEEIVEEKKVRTCDYKDLNKDNDCCFFKKRRFYHKRKAYKK